MQHSGHLVLIGVGRFLPLIFAVPVMLAASYYLVVVNGPTPVVKERDYGDASEKILELVVALMSKDYNSASDF